jgi:predicted dehydrogenase
MSGKSRCNRRDFLKTAVGGAIGAISFPYIIPSSAIGKANTVSPSNRITMGCIGVGWMGTSNMEVFLNESDVLVVAICDVDSKHLEKAINTVNTKYGNKDCVGYHDFRELLARGDIDAVSIGTPDHWHAIPAIAAAKAGKDIYSEKPLAYTLMEGRAICDAVKQNGNIWQTGSWQRSISNFRFACELVLNGCVGKVHRVEVGLPAGHNDFAGTKGQETIEVPPAELDYDFWTGPAPYEPYCPARVHKNWRWVMDYGGGQLMDWIGHHNDIAHWGMGTDYTGPVEIEGVGEYPKTGIWNSPTKYRITSRYANGIEMVIAGGYDDICGGTKWIGENGWVWVTRGKIDASPKNLLNAKFGPNEINLYHSPGHHRNFLDCIKSRMTTLTPCEIAHRSASPGHLGNIAMKLGRKLKWDPENEKFIKDEEANRLLSRPMRGAWHV